jgi:hypothetical protein
MCQELQFHVTCYFPYVFTYFFRSLTRPRSLSGVWSNYFSHRRPGRPALASLTRHLPSTHTGHWVRTGYFLTAATRTGSARPRQQKGSSQAVAVEKTKQTLSARCSLSLSLSLSLSESALPCFLPISHHHRVPDACGIRLSYCRLRARGRIDSLVSGFGAVFCSLEAVMCPVASGGRAGVK